MIMIMTVIGQTFDEQQIAVETAVMTAICTNISVNSGPFELVL